MNIEKNIERIKLFGLTADVKTSNGVKHFHQGHEYVEIGGIKWATMNIGANSLIDNGLYFAWGETQGYSAEEVPSKKKFSWNGADNDYRFTPSGFVWNAELDYRISKYNSADGLTTLTSEDDAVTTAWGNGWRTPTSDEFRVLANATTSTWVSQRGCGISGRLLTDKLDKSKALFFPAAGFCGCGNVSKVGSYGFYWSSSLNSNDVDDASDLHFYSRCMAWDGYNSRYCGFSLRGVAS